MDNPCAIDRQVEKSSGNKKTQNLWSQSIIKLHEGYDSFGKDFQIHGLTFFPSFFHLYVPGDFGL